MPTKNPLHPRAVAIPTFWSGEQALDVVAFLETIIVSIWRLHGDSMIQPLRQARHRAAPAMPCNDDGLREDDIPF